MEWRSHRNEGVTGAINVLECYRTTVHFDGFKVYTFVELGHIRSLVPLQQLHIYTLAPQVLLISDLLPESTHRQPQ